MYDFGIDELGPYYTMEMLDGTDLRARCPLPWREVCTYLRDVAFPSACFTAAGSSTATSPSATFG